MQYLTHFVHAFLMFVAPLKFLNYKSTIKQKLSFVLSYGLAIIFSRRIYDFIPLFFGTHTIILVIVSTVLFKKIVKNISWLKSFYISLILFIAMLANDSLIMVPIMRLLNLTIKNLEGNDFLIFLISTILSNFILILACIVSYLNNKKDKYISLNS